jgi:hypothetical protein
MKRRTPLKPSSKPLKRTKLKAVSAKRAKEMKQYKVLREDLLKHRPMCDAYLILLGLDRATIDNIQAIAVIALWQGMDVPPIPAGDRASEFKEMGIPAYCPRSFDCHHSKRRGKHYLDASSFLAVSRSLHQRIHDHPAWARENGLLA